ncbi:MAG: G5 domain-containing protein [Clostridia bacterium]|nr:G5 domain-containing protein [Clostridia bacterium]
MTIRRIGDTTVLSPYRRIGLFLLAVLFLISVTAFAAPPTLYSVTVLDGETVSVVNTSAIEPEAVLADAGVHVNEAYGDVINTSNFTPGKDGCAILVLRGVRVNVYDSDGSLHTVYASGLVSDVIRASGVDLRDGCSLNHSLADPLEEGLTIEIYGFYQVTVTVDGKTVTKTVSAPTVGNALAAMGVNLGPEDVTDPTPDTVLTKDVEVRVYRVKTAERTEEVTIPFETEYNYSDRLERNKMETVVQGVDGKKAVVYSERFVDGKLTDSTVKSEKMISEPVNEVINIGTKNEIHPSQIPSGNAISEMPVPSYVTIGAGGIPTNYRQVINAKATAYCIPGGITSTGKRAQTGYIAVDPKEIPYGTEMYIVSADGRYVYGYCIAADTGGFIHDVDWTVDLFMNSTEQCINWGRRDVIIFIL